MCLIFPWTHTFEALLVQALAEIGLTRFWHMLINMQDNNASRAERFWQKIGNKSRNATLAKIGKVTRTDRNGKLVWSVYHISNRQGMWNKTDTMATQEGCACVLLCVCMKGWGLVVVEGRDGGSVGPCHQVY